MKRKLMHNWIAIADSDCFNIRGPACASPANQRQAQPYITPK
jgi:hypothetical protein